MPKIKKSKKADRDIEFLFEVGTMRNLDRVWRQFMDPGVANCAEHTFRVAWIALTISKMEGKGDHEKILKIALAHDLAETRTGDVHYLSRQYTKRDEQSAVIDIFTGTAHEKEMIALAEEYEKRESIESRIVKDADNIDVNLELRELHSKGHSLGSIWRKSRRENLYPKLFTKTAKKLWNSIETAEPHDWHNNSLKNRFSAGDWKKGYKKA